MGKEDHLESLLAEYFIIDSIYVLKYMIFIKYQHLSRPSF